MGRRPSRLHPFGAACLGAGAVVITAAVLGTFHADLTRATPALLLVVPIVFSAVLGGRMAAYVVSLVATVAFSLLIPPVGSIRVGLPEDAVALAVFLIVAVVVGSLVARRIELLDELDRQRVVLLRAVSHDLRTPLAAISSAASSLESGVVADAGQQAELLAIVVDEADRLDRLVGNLLSLGRVESGGLRPRRQSVDMGELVSLCARRLGRLTNRTPIEVDVAADVPPIEADHALLEQVLVNLLENALRHSPPGRPVRVEVRREAGSVDVTVLDEGPGPPPALRPQLFQPFRPGPGSTSSGVGLAICRAVVEAHGGTIAFRDGPGPGGRFVVRLPLD